VRLVSTAKKPILVVGATGRHGGTGAFVARRLVGLGHPIRAMTRRKDALVRQLPGAEIVVADLHDRRALIPALAGTDVAYFTYPIASGIVDAAANFASAARASGLKRLVVMSMGMREPRPLNNLFETVTKERPMTLSEALSSGYLSFDRSTLPTHRP
jgi:uncharacterized protein YbjT (DUF2867 family)